MGPTAKAGLPPTVNAVGGVFICPAPRRLVGVLCGYICVVPHENARKYTKYSLRFSFCPTQIYLANPIQTPPRCRTDCCEILAAIFASCRMKMLGNTQSIPCAFHFARHKSISQIPSKRRRGAGLDFCVALPKNAPENRILYNCSPENEKISLG